MPIRQARSRYRYAWPLTIVTILVIAGLTTSSTYLLPLEVWLPSLRTWTEGQSYLGVLIFGLIYVISVLLFVPGALLTLLAGGIFGVVWGTVIVSVASSIADGIAITDAGWPVVALLRLSPTVPYSASNYLYGLTGIPFLSYWITTWAFTLPGTIAYVYLGYASSEAFAENTRTTVDWYLLYLGLAATLGAAIYLAIFARRALRKIEQANT